MEHWRISFRLKGLRKNSNLMKRETFLHLITMLIELEMKYGIGADRKWDWHTRWYFPEKRFKQSLLLFSSCLQMWVSESAIVGAQRTPFPLEEDQINIYSPAFANITKIQFGLIEKERCTQLVGWGRKSGRRGEGAGTQWYRCIGRRKLAMFPFKKLIKTSSERKIFMSLPSRTQGWKSIQEFWTQCLKISAF